MYLEKINAPQDVKKLSLEEMTALAAEMRTALLQKLSRHGGHFGPNLGMVEATIAMHYVFDSPKDKIVFDVSHQSYCHKMLTGRREAFLKESHYDDVSGYTNPEESEHDFFNIGHTSTSVSLASGLAKARDLKGESGNVIAVIGDGSLSGAKHWKAWILPMNCTAISSFWSMTMTCQLQKITADCIRICGSSGKQTDSIRAISSAPWDWITAL